MNKINHKIFASILLCIILISTCSNTILAVTELSDAYIQKIATADHHLKYYKEQEKKSTYVICSVVGHYYQGNFYPAYCLNKVLEGVGEAGSYSVDIDGVMKNDKVWRAIKNGYPYKKAADLGLSSDYDAFVVTKMAVYCVLGQSKLEYFSADDNDAEGQAMLTALKKLVNIGNNGSEKQSSSLKLVKSGDFVEDGNYYSIKYKVQSTVEVKNYTITGISNLPEGTLVTDTSGNIKTSFSGNNEFKIKIPKNKLSSDIKGKISVKAESKTYPIFYGKTRISGTQNYVLTGDSYEAQTAEIELDIKTNNGKVVVNKIDSETKEPVEGITFTLLDQKNNVLKTAVTNSEGKAEFTNLYQGSYIIKETKTTEKYEINNNEFLINVEYNKTASVQVENKHTLGKLKIYKVDKDNNGIALGNIKFDLYSHEFAKVVGTYYTDANGEISIDNLRTGKYSLIEKDTNKWYNVSDNTQIEVKPNTTTEVKVENELKKGMVRIEKIDGEDNSIKISGVKFDVFDQNMNKLEEIITNNEGIAYTSKYAVRDYQKLYIKEKETDKAYKLDEKIYEVELKENDTTNITIANQRKKGKIKVVKVDKDNNEVMLEGVEFNILNSKEQVVDTIKTDSKGEATTKELPIGEEYTVVETKTKENYKLTEEIQKVKLEEEEIKNLKFVNEKKKGIIKVIKVDKDNNEVLLEGVEFNILNSKGEVVDTIVTNELGEAESKKLPIDEEYTIVETKTKENYVLTEEKQKVTLQENQITNIKFENEKKKGTIKVIKVDKDNNEVLLEGVEFNILNSKGEVVDTIVTNELGEAESKKLPIDEEYTIVETKTKENYVLTEEKQTVTLQENQITNIKFENEKKKGKIKIIKTSKDDNVVTDQKAGTPLEGVEFEIFDEKNNFIQTIKTDSKGIAISEELQLGKYKVKEKKTGEWYVLDQTYHELDINENEEIVTLEIKNDSVRPEVKLEKKGPEKAQPDEEIKYEFTIENKSNTELDNFCFVDKLPTEYIKAKKIETGTYTNASKYDLYYKTNMTNEYVLLMEDLSSTENNEIDFSKEFADNEFVTEIKFDFKTVDVGFKTETSPLIYAKVNSNIKSEDTFINESFVEGNYHGFKASCESKWKTMCYKILPLTGI